MERFSVVMELKHSKGVMILRNPKYDIDVIKFEKDNHGRLIVLNTKMNGVKLVLMNLYAPNDISQQVQFFEKVMNKLSNYADENIIIGGDFNCSLTELDKVGGKPVENKQLVVINFPAVRSILFVRRLA